MAGSCANRGSQSVRNWMLKLHGYKELAANASDRYEGWGAASLSVPVIRISSWILSVMRWAASRRCAVVQSAA